MFQATQPATQMLKAACLLLAIACVSIPLFSVPVSVSGEPIQRQLALSAQSDSKNGFFLVLREVGSNNAGKALVDDEQFLINDYNFLDIKPDSPPEQLVVRKIPDVPLILASIPTTEKDSGGLTRLYVSLAEDQIKELRQFTEQNIGRKVAIVIGGEVITVHKIRSTISDGRMQITRCYDNACEILLLELKRKVIAK